MPFAWFCIISDSTNMRCALLRCSSLESSAKPGRCCRPSSGQFSQNTRPLYARATTGEIGGLAGLSFYLQGLEINNLICVCILTAGATFKHLAAPQWLIGSLC